MPRRKISSRRKPQSPLPEEQPSEPPKEKREMPRRRVSERSNARRISPEPEPPKKRPPRKEPPKKTLPQKAPKRTSTKQTQQTKKKARVEPFRFVNTDADPIIENLREVSARYKKVRSADFEVLDHVALEGLTGIKFGRLCLLLDAIIPSLNACNEDMAQDHIWAVIVNGYMRRAPGARIQIFYSDLTQKDSPKKQHPCSDDQDSVEQNKNFCIDKAIKLPNQSLKRIAKSDWMLHPVLDGEIMGSCPNYTSRRNISLEVLQLFNEHGSRGSLNLVHEKYNLDNIYFVADQEVRRRALLPMSIDPNMDMKLREYACLELIGRTRCFGIVFPNDKTLGRYRILLTAKGLITQYQQTCNTFIIHHIKRFSRFNLDSGVKAFKGGMDESTKERTVQVYDDEDDEFIETDELATVKKTCCNPARLKCDRSILRMVYDTIALSKGRSMCDIRRKLRLPKFHVRNHLKNLANTGLIGSHTRLVNEKKTRIYRARHKSTRRKVARQKKVLRGVKAKWDESDLRAKELLGFRRSQFSQAEDSLITLCRITGLLIDPSYPKSFIVPKQVVRDILHDELFESHDKTSDALLRRVKYLRRLPSNVALINEITAELRDDLDIMRMIESNKEISKSDDKIVIFFKQLLRAVRAKLPHLLGLTHSGLVAHSPIEIKDYEDLITRYELIDCRDNQSKKTYHQPVCTLVQLVRSTPQCYRLNVTKCEDMQTIMLIASRCVQTSFNLDLKLKVPVRVVGLDQDNEYYKDIFERAKECKEASRMIANLTSPNPTADSRRALFMLRNALKLQSMDKCGKLADALIIQPCDIEFSSKEEIVFDGKQALENFLESSRFSNEMRVEFRNKDRESLNKRRREKDRRRRQSRDTNQKSSPDNPANHQTAMTSQQASKYPGQPSGSRPLICIEESSQTKQEKLFKMIESIMSWIGAYPGIELENLQKNLAPLFGDSLQDHLNELLELMIFLELISRDIEPGECQKPLLFGYRNLTEEERKPIITFAPRENAYVRLCQLIDVEL